VEGAVAVASHPTISQTPAAAAGAETLDNHKMVVTLTTPAWVDNDDYYLCEFTFVTPGVCEVDILSACANFTLRA
jgi:hypothetical protein